MSTLTPFLDHMRPSIQSSDESSPEDSDAPADCSDLSDASVEDDELSADEDVEIGEGEKFVSKDGTHVYTTALECRTLPDVEAGKTSCETQEDQPLMSYLNQLHKVCHIS